MTNQRLGGLAWLAPKCLGFVFHILCRSGQRSAHWPESIHLPDSLEALSFATLQPMNRTADGQRGGPS